MSEESKANDMGTVWRNQPAEIPISLEGLMNRRARELYSATRAEILLSIGAAFFFIAVLAWRFAADHDRIPQLGVAAALAWVLISLYWFRDRIRGKGSPGRDALAATGVEFYRKELERRRDHLKNAWLWHGPLLLACITLIAVLIGRQYVTYRGVGGVLPLLVLLGLWTAYGILRRLRQAGELQREIEEIESASRS